MAFSDPQSNLEKFGLQEGSHVADIGAGSGFYTLVAAKLVGDTGKVYAIDVQQDLLARLKNAAHGAHLNNIEVVHANAEKLGGSHLKDVAVDSVLVCNVLFQIETKEDFVKEIQRILKPGGRVLVIDWRDSFGGMGPDQKLVISEGEAKALFEEQGFSFVSDFDAGDNHYALIYRKP